jgi:hypothetical protein
VAPNNVQNFIFQFFIYLHADDKDVLYYIQEKLGIGSVQIVRTEKRNEASFIVRKIEEIKIIIDIFDRQSLNTSKHLNFLVFKEAFELYHNLCNNYGLTVEDRNARINRLISGMNSKRSYFQMPEFHKTLITPYWFLGFVEGEGCFTVTNKGKDRYRLGFIISQSAKDLLLMQELCDFLNRLPFAFQTGSPIKDYGTVANISSNKTLSNLPFYGILLSVNATPYIRDVFIPFLAQLDWLSKKKLDFED